MKVQPLWPPALTKADRRADCLPVVLPFCVSKTADPENRKDNDYNLVDLKAELLQNEDVKNLSTAALVSLVRTWSNPSTGNLPQQNAILQDSELRNKLISTFTPEDIDDVKNASKIFLKNMKKLLQSADPELTESSDDGSSDLEQSEESPAQKKALWKFMKQRAALASRATLLTAKIRELENQLRTVAGYLTKVNSSYGDLRFEDQRTSTTTTLPIFVSESSGDVSLESAMKLNKPKSLNRPVNGYLDHGPINNTIHVGTTNSYDTSVCLSKKLIALLDPPFHPHLSFEKDISLLMHFENILKKNEAQYQSERSASPSSHRRLSLGTKQRHLNDTKSHGRKLKRYSHLSEKYRKKKKHFRKHKLVFGKWRKFQNKIHARDRFRRFSVASSCSSLDSPVPSPMSFQDDGSGFDGKRRRDDNQFDIDDVIIPYSNKRGRLVKFEFKDIEIPSWRSIEYDKLQSIDMEEDTSDTAYIKRHESYEVEERKIIRTGGGALCFFNTWQKRAGRQHRSDSRADSSGANTPDPTLICDQDILFQDTNSMHAKWSFVTSFITPKYTI
ncbi:KAT8 regulatory NSL complex subunit 1-like protein [Caerostris darwini]|uniref:KAT8 regulatory NSL complex subunit 1-like protein n=1 Tax=Caerostris darwini TaxID=1538125 RepID=A0AAV4RNB4_9ARAC|nr:KAT8 regulatory NSL complex subunit 1-like protein [Caerostris darwini]